MHGKEHDKGTRGDVGKFPNLRLYHDFVPVSRAFKPLPTVVAKITVQWMKATSVLKFGAKPVDYCVLRARTESYAPPGSQNHASSRFELFSLYHFRLTKCTVRSSASFTPAFTSASVFALVSVPAPVPASGAWAAQCQRPQR